MRPNIGDTPNTRPIDPLQASIPRVPNACPRAARRPWSDEWLADGRGTIERVTRTVEEVPAERAEARVAAIEDICDGRKHAQTFGRLVRRIEVDQKVARDFPVRIPVVFVSLGIDAAAVCRIRADAPFGRCRVVEP